MMVMKSKKAIVLTLAILAVSVLISVIITSFAEGGFNKKRNITVVFYNVENLFDTKNDMGDRDGEFTPDGANKWTEYYQKRKTFRGTQFGK